MGGGEYNEDGVWQPNAKGLGLKHVMDFINVGERMIDDGEDD